MNAAKHLVTTRLSLHPAGTADRAFVGTLLSDPQVRAFLGGPVPPDQLEAAIDANLRALDGEQIWIVQLQQRPPVGLVSITRHKDGAAFELSYQFVPNVWGQGIASEALSAVLGDVGGIIAETQKANAASVALLCKLGFAQFDELTRFGHVQLLFERQR